MHDLIKNPYSVELLTSSAECALYAAQPLVPSNAPLECYVASTPESRCICNDPFLVGVQYTRTLQRACEHIVTALRQSLDTRWVEAEATVLHLLRGGMNFGVREALAYALDWNYHSSIFLSAQRTPTDESSKEWRIVENSYKKIDLPARSQIFFGDVVATGTSLWFAVEELIAYADKQSVEVVEVVFFTIGSPRAISMMERFAEQAGNRWSSFRGIKVVFLEGIFAVADSDTPLSIKIAGTDLLRRDSLLAPEFIESQYEKPCYPLERCVIYDAGSRSFSIPEYLDDLRHYWSEVQGLAKGGTSFAKLLSERAPEIDSDAFGEVDLRQLSEAQLGRANAILDLMAIG